MWSADLTRGDDEGAAVLVRLLLTYYQEQQCLPYQSHNNVFEAEPTLPPSSLFYDHSVLLSRVVHHSDLIGLTQYA